MLMKTIFLSALFLFLGIFSIQAQEFPSLRKEWAENDAENENPECVSVSLEAEYGVPIIPPETVKDFLNCESGITQSGELNGRYLAWTDGSQIRMYDQLSGATSTLMSVFEDSEGISGLQWEDNGDGNDTTELVFMNINRRRYKKGVKLFVLSVYEGDLVEKFSDEVEAAITCGSAGCELEGLSFYDGIISYISGNPDDQHIGMKVRNYFRPGEFDEMTIFNTGFDDWWAKASVYYHELMGPEGKVELPKEVAHAFAPHGRAVLSPDHQYLYYFDMDRNLMSYSFGSRKTNLLMTLLPAEENLQFTITMKVSPSGRFLAFVNENEAAYSRTGMKLFVLELTSGKLKTKQKWEIDGKSLYKLNLDDENVRFPGKGFYLQDEWVKCEDGCTISFQ